MGAKKRYTDQVFGIDLGTTSSCIAYVDDNDQAVMVRSKEGSCLTPSVVYYEKPDSVFVGREAKVFAVTDPANAVINIKREMGNPNARRIIRGRSLSPEEVSAEILRKVVQSAEVSLREAGVLEQEASIRNVVITCPAYFGDPERKATQNAGLIAGLNVVSIINEPTAAALFYGVNQGSQEKTVLVYDLGGGTFDATMMHIRADGIRVISTGGQHDLGGKDWDDRLMALIADRFEEETGVELFADCSPQLIQQLQLQAEQKKIQLSDKEEAFLPVPFENSDVPIRITRQDFENRTADLLQTTIDLTRDILEEAEKKGFYLRDVSEILLVGGSCRMPQVLSRVQAEFGKPVKLFSPEFAVAKGAAIFGSRKSDRSQHEPGPAIVNVTSRSYGILARRGGVEQLMILIRKNQELPASAVQTFYTPETPEIALRIMDCFATEEAVPPSVGRELGSVTFRPPLPVPKNTRLDVALRLDESGLLHLTAEEFCFHRKFDVDFHCRGSIGPEQVMQARDLGKGTTVH